MDIKTPPHTRAILASQEFNDLLNKPLRRHRQAQEIRDTAKELRHADRDRFINMARPYIIRTVLPQIKPHIKPILVAAKHQMHLLFWDHLYGELLATVDHVSRDPD